MIFRQAVLCFMMAFALLTGARGAVAQDITIEHDQVMGLPEAKHLPEEYIAPPITYHGLIIGPRLYTAIAYNDNIFNASSAEEDDFILTARPEISIEKHYRDHMLKTSFEAEKNFFKYNDDEDSLNYAASVSGHVTATSSLKLPFKLSYKRKAIPREEAGTTSETRDPVYTEAAQITVGANYRFNRLQLALLGEYARVTFDNDTNRITGAPVILDRQNRTEHNATLRATYDVLGSRNEQPDHFIFANLSHKRIRYDHKPNESGTIDADTKDSNETGILVGLSTNYKGLVIGSIGAGYIDQEFPHNDDTNQIDFYADLAWLIRPKLTLFFEASRDIDRNNSFSNGVVKSRGELGFQYELHHDLFAGAEFAYTNSDFTDDPNGREDELGETTLSLRYYHSPRFKSELSYGYKDRESNVSAQDFTQNIFLYSLVTDL